MNSSLHYLSKNSICLFNQLFLGHTVFDGLERTWWAGVRKTVGSFIRFLSSSKITGKNSQDKPGWYYARLWDSTQRSLTSSEGFNAKSSPV